MLTELIDKKVDEIFLAYHKARNITNNDIRLEDEYDLQVAKDKLEDIIRKICRKQEDATNYYDLVPSWYVYTDCDGEVHSEAFGIITEDAFFTKVSKKICHGDLDNSTVHKIFYKGEEFIYAGWQPGMKYEFLAVIGDANWVGYFPEWDH